MQFVFTIQVISVLLVSKPNKSLGCDEANWLDSLDYPGWSVYPKANTYLQRLLTSKHVDGDERVG